ncbi:MAG: bifunctional (p)ppGpp synthetase/guanosine-3',5'-bis(diphosphate) 3'-pyrophosphohydrolase [Dehalococcoidales bacterium]|nr:bifunctional (p)ppGpp synthetase/guanosine-3',5'-bis(diphosphate) 3'-pyrophosphohydrolase [Dehalococcoidales bacterium]
MPVTELIEKAKAYLPAEKVAVIERAYEFALKAHEGQTRKSGEPYIEHPLHVAMILVNLQLDASSLAAALLHDVEENCGIPNSELIEKFGPEIAKLVEATTKLGKLSLQTTDEAIKRGGALSGAGQAENMRKMLVAMAEDLRVVFIKLADRLHNMRTLQALTPEQQMRISRETLDIYAPLAHRLGIWELKWQLEDYSFRYLEPEKYRSIASRIASKRADRERFLAEVTWLLKQEFEKSGIKAEISGRAKHLYSISQKIERYKAMGKDFDDIHDLLALRIVVDTIPECYTALGIVHNLWHPLPEQFNDYIANPKMNGYQSLHTTVMCERTMPLEIQIRTREMHHIAEYGVAVHWRYKEGGKEDLNYENGIGWLRQLIDWHRELSGAEEFLESVRTDVFSDQVFVYTPKGDVKDLPKGSTPLDFAFRIHTDLGSRCIGAKVNGKLVTLNTELHNGDIVEILASKAPRAPSRDWLNPNLGYIKTTHARSKIRQWFTKQERTENVERGREMLEKFMRHLGIKFTERTRLAELFNYDTIDEFYAALGYGGITTQQIAAKLAPEEPEVVKPTGTTPPKKAVSSIRVLGAGDMLTSLAQCCNAVPGDEIIGFVTRSRGVSIHRKDCVNIVNEEEKERLIPVDWGQTDLTYPVTVVVDAWNRVGLARDITVVVAAEKVNIANMNVSEKPDQQATISITLDIEDLSQLSRVLSRIEGVRGVINVARAGEGTPLKSNPQP